MEPTELLGAGDDRLNPPSVTPDPAPADDQLVAMAAASTIVGLVFSLIALRWFRRNVTIAWRKP